MSCLFTCFLQLKIGWKGFANQMCSCFMQCPNILGIGAVRKSEDHQRSVSFSAGAIEILTWIKSATLHMSSLFHHFRFGMPVSTVLKSYFADTQVEREAKPVDPQMSKLMATEHEDERADHLKRKGRYWSLHLYRIIKSTYRLFYEIDLTVSFLSVSRFD